MDKKTKKILISVSIIMIVVAVGIVISRLIPPTTSTDNINTKFDDVTIDGLRFSNVNIVGNQLTALVQNVLSTESSLKNITVKFMDSNNNEIESVDAYIGGSFQTNEIRSLDVKTDADLSNVSNINYTLNYSSCVVTRGQYVNSPGATVGTWTASYQCNGTTGYIFQCAYTGKYFNVRGSQIGTYNNLICDGGTENKSKTYACTSNYNQDSYQEVCNSKLAINSTSGFYSHGASLPSSISCSCDD